MTTTRPLTVAAFVILVLYATTSTPDPNATPVYGDTGFPKNCRAIIADNIDHYQSGDYTAVEVLDSINRNCGRDGYSWDAR